MDPYKIGESDFDEIEGNTMIHGVSLATLFDQLKITDVSCICAIDNGEWWTEMYEVLPEVWEPSIDEVEPADPWSIKDEEVDHLT